MKFLFLLLGSAPLTLAQLKQINPFTSTPLLSSARMFLYEPSNLPPNPPIVVGIHYCTGSAQKYYNSNPGLHKLADEKKYLVIYPESPNEGGCWDVSSRETLKREGGRDSHAVAEMVRWAKGKYWKGEGKGVFVVGESSGGMMASILAAAYPDLFTAIINYSGVAAGCFFTDTVAGWNGTCSGGRIEATKDWWAKWVFDAYPGYNGTRPRMQLYHGDVDTTIAPANYNYSIAQWTTVLGYGATPLNVKADTPEKGYTTQVFGPLLTGVYAHGVGHGVPVHPEEDVKFWGL